MLAAEGAVVFLERVADHWGELCASKEVASEWADRLLDTTRLALGPDPNLRGHFHGTAACLSALYRAGRYAEPGSDGQPERRSGRSRTVTEAAGLLENLRRDR